MSRNSLGASATRQVEQIVNNPELVQIVRARMQGEESANEPNLDGAACDGMDPDIFFPGPNDSKERAQAINVCGKCCVRLDCLAADLPRGDLQYGIRGGYTETVRRTASSQIFNNRTS
jgi:hypothetical protein